ncbi:MAG: alpha/beta hydrolase [Pseudooceanicola sp.]|nr:alpha/beta hydrolase [Pseudooceanicola sp.]
MLTVENEGAALACEVTGEGPVLLTIAGGGGTGARYQALARALPDFTVVTWDRRCCGASTGDRDLPLDMDQQARDALALIDALGAERAHVFGNSGGANIALRLAEIAPERVGAVIAHEPPVLPLLPDAAKWVAFSDRLAAICREDGPFAAMGLFISEVPGVDGPPPPPRPGPADLRRFLLSELTVLCRYAPGPLEGVRLTLAVGADSGDAYYVRAAHTLAERTGAPLEMIAGHHFSYIDQPEVFARLIREAI